MDAVEAREILESMAQGDEIDVSLGNGVVISRKDLIKQSENDFMIFHGITGSCTYFTLDQAIEVLTGARSPWDGEYDEDEED